MILGLEHSAPPRPLQKEGTFEMKLDFDELAVWRTQPPARTEVHPNSMGTEAPMLGILYLFIWVFICFLFNILYDKLVNVSRCFPEFCELFQQIIEPEGGIGNPYLQLVIQTCN